MILSCDPAYAKPSAFALFSKEGVLLETFKTNDVSILEAHIKGKDILFFCEDQFFMKNNDTLKRLARQTGKFEGLMELHTFPVRYVNVKSWQKFHNIEQKPRDIPAYAWKKIHSQHLINKATELAGLDITNEDVACAILIGLYARTLI